MQPYNNDADDHATSKSHTAFYPADWTKYLIPFAASTCTFIYIIGLLILY